MVPISEKNEGMNKEQKQTVCRAGQKLSMTSVSTFLTKKPYARHPTYQASSLIKIARMLSVCPTNFPICLPVLEPQVRITHSGPPDVITLPAGSVAMAYIDDFGPGTSGGKSVIIGVLHVLQDPIA